jgi:hypothetical protein
LPSGSKEKSTKKDFLRGLKACPIHNRNDSTRPLTLPNSPCKIYEPKSMKKTFNEKMIQNKNYWKKTGLIKVLYCIGGF